MGQNSLLKVLYKYNLIELKNPYNKSPAVTPGHINKMTPSSKVYLSIVLNHLLYSGIHFATKIGQKKEVKFSGVVGCSIQWYHTAIYNFQTCKHFTDVEGSFV